MVVFCCKIYLKLKMFNGWNDSLSGKLPIFTVIKVRLNKHISGLGRALSGLLRRHFLFEESKRSSQHRHLPLPPPSCLHSELVCRNTGGNVSAARLTNTYLGLTLTNQDLVKFPSKLGVARCNDCFYLTCSMKFCVI